MIPDFRSCDAWKQRLYVKMDNVTAPQKQSQSSSIETAKRHD